MLKDFSVTPKPVPTDHKSIFEMAQNTNAQLKLSNEEWQELKQNVQKDVMENVESKYLGKYRDTEASGAIRRQVLQSVEKNQPGLSLELKQSLVDKLTNEISGYGILEQFLDEPDVTEILVERYDKITVERNGELYATDVKFDNEVDLKMVLDRILMPLGRRLDYSSPTANARLSDGSRICALIPPVAPEGTQASIRKFKPNVSLDKLIEYGALDERIKQALIACVKARLSIIVSGGTGSGKTTFLNALSEYIDSKLSIITIEDPIELQFNHPHVRRWEARPQNLEGKGAISQYDLVVVALRSRPDIIIVGESRGVEAFALMQALNSGHLGSMSSIHANNTFQGMKRLVTMVSTAGEIPPAQVPEYITDSLDLVVQLMRKEDSTRKVTEIAEVVGVENGVILTNPLIRFEGFYDGEKVHGNWIPTGNKFMRASVLKERGIEFPGWE
jgi:Flp pilus assembly protein, ATPase CpaF